MSELPAVISSNTIYSELLQLSIVKAETVKPFFSSIRDRSDVGVLRCESSGVIFLDRTKY